MRNRKRIVALVIAIGLAGITVFAQNPRATIHERAKASGGKLVWRYRANRSVIYQNVDHLAKASDDIVIGRVLGHRPSLSRDGKLIANDFLVKVQDVIKGNLAGGRSIFVSIPGGAYRFPDRTYAAVLATGYKEPQDRGIYAFFLKNSTNLKGHALVSESQGLFALKNGTVEPADLITRDPVVSNYRGMASVNFIRELQKAVPRRKR